MRRHLSITRAAAGFVLAAAGALALAGPAAADSGFSTAPKHAAPTSSTQTVVTSVRVGHHATFDRVVFTFSGPRPGYDVRYVSKVISDASGATVQLQGSAFLHVVLRPTSTTTHAPQDTLTPGFPALKQVKGAGDFEGVTSYGIGVARRLPFRVFTLTDPRRLVVDIALPGGPQLPPTGGNGPPLALLGLVLLGCGVLLHGGVTIWRSRN